MQINTAYKIFGLEKNSTIQEIKKIHRKLVLKYHPDRYINFGQQAWATNKFIQIQEAYELLLKQHNANIPILTQKRTDNNEKTNFDSDFKINFGEPLKSDKIEDEPITFLGTLFDFWERFGNDVIYMSLFMKLIYFLFSGLIFIIFLPGLFAFISSNLILLIFLQIFDKVGIPADPVGQKMSERLAWLFVLLLTCLSSFAFLVNYINTENIPKILSLYLLTSVGSSYVFFVLSEIIGFVLTLVLRHKAQGKIKPLKVHLKNYSG